MFLRSLTLIAAALAAILIGYYIWMKTYQSTLEELNAYGQENLNQAVSQFVSQVSIARVLPTLLARNSIVVSSVETDIPNNDVIDYLTRAHYLTSAHDVRIFDTNGIEILSTSREEVRRNRSGANYFRTALDGALGVAISYDKATNRRTLSFARSILNQTNQTIGVVVVDVNLEPLESVFNARSDLLMLTDQSGVVMFSNRSPLLFRKLLTKNSTFNSREYSASHPIKLVSNLNVNSEKKHGIELWSNFPEATSQAPMIMHRQAILPLSVDAVLLTDSLPANEQANKITLLYFAIIALFLAISFAIYQRRQHLVELLNAEKELTVELDRRVAIRSKELENAQSQLVQAAKLSALGKMSAGISHELNQPIASIQNFAVNARRLIANGKLKESDENLVDIESQIDRMSRIIKNLRNFARKDIQSAGPVSITKIVENAIKQSQSRLDEDNVSLKLINLNADIVVNGGEVRLQQVLINLISNAIDALSNQKVKHIEIEINESPNEISVMVSDNGPGITDPDRVFEPFYTTKSGAKDDGLGLGLSISYGFVESFGGSLRAKNLAKGGALFTLTLPRYKKTADANE